MDSSLKEGPSAARKRQSSRSDSRPGRGYPEWYEDAGTEGPRKGCNEGIKTWSGAPRNAAKDTAAQAGPPRTVSTCLSQSCAHRLAHWHSYCSLSTSMMILLLESYNLSLTLFLAPTITSLHSLSLRMRPRMLIISHPQALKMSVAPA